RGQRDLLRAAFFALLDAVQRVKEVAAERIPASRESQSHEPSAGLLIAFMQLFQGVQRHANGFTARHTDFYYHDVLAMQPRAAAPDRVHLVCELVPGGPTQAVVPRGTAFAAGKDAQQRPIQFIGEHELVVTDTRVASLRSLRLERAPLLLGDGPDDQFDCVKRIRADIPAGLATAPGQPQPYWPLFGGVLDAGASTHRDADLGLAIGSPVLWLKEGQRDIRITLTLRDAPGKDSLWTRMAGGDDRVQWQFVRALPQLFRVSFTSAAGWWDASDCFIGRSPGAKGDTGDRLEITVRLRPEAPPIIGCVPALHGNAWNTTLPMVRILVRQDAALCAYSLLDQTMLEQATVWAGVHGARDIVLANQLGRLDPSTPFMPFGPLPEPGAYLVFGSAEAASKPLRRLRLNLQWGGLPQGLGGFPEYYAGYDTAFENDSFKAKVSVLQEGLWRASPANPAGMPLFAPGPGARVAPASRLVVGQDELLAYFKPTAPRPGVPLVYDVGSRNGFFKMELREPQAGFGHAEYTRVLTRTVSANARRKKPSALPHAPYTPVIERVTMDYEAQAVIRLDRAGSAQDEDGAAPPGEVFHIHPFGVERIHPGPPGAHTVLPTWEQDGNLYIGLAGSDPQGTLSLLFELRSEAAEPLLHRTARVTWSCLRANRWIELPTARVLADTTGGFLTSGIVTLDLPSGMDREHTVMPSGVFWLRACADTDYDSFAALYSVRAQALSAVRSPASSLPPQYRALPPGSVGAPVESIAGLAKTVQVGPSFGMSPVETEAQLQVRTGERLKHKNRALLPWDYERLVLERFPSVFKVRCFNHLSAPGGKSSPGSVLVVVVPALGGDEEQKNIPGPRLNAIELEDIEDYLAGLSSPFARIAVRNCSYEAIQVRCSVAWRRGSNAGYCERRLNQALFDYLSPWNDNGLRARFEWAVRREDIEAHIRALDDVEFVGGVSLLHVAASDGSLHSLDDTARPRGAAEWDATDPAGSGLRQARARWPWSIAVPMRHHLIETLQTAQHGGARPTGVGQLAIGNTFVVGGRA
ncbi:hypothetical protein, partial [Ramlibacter sp.]|uniref:hypothetical protein n=1 Tax=Ramlibacter sp. TaxID=1917967 RepID=UPI00180580B7